MAKQINPHFRQLTVPVAKILEIYKMIQHKRKMQDVVGDEQLQTTYGCECLAMWQALQIMYGHEQLSQTIDAVNALAKQHNEAAA